MFSTPIIIAEAEAIVLAHQKKQFRNDVLEEFKACCKAGLGVPDRFSHAFPVMIAYLNESRYANLIMTEREWLIAHMSSALTIALAAKSPGEFLKLLDIHWLW